MTSVASTKVQLVLAAILAAGGVGLAVSAALDQTPDVEVIEQDPSTTPPPRTSGSGGGGAAAPAAPAQTPAGTEQTPAGTSGTTTVPATSTGTASQPQGVGNPNGCVMPQPGVGWTCQNGAWYAPGSMAYVDPSTGQVTSQPGAATSTATLNLPGFPSSTVTGYPGMPSAAAGGLPGAPSVGFIAAPGAANCMTTPPGLGMTCQNGVWVTVQSGAAAVVPYSLNSPDVPMSGVAMIPVGNVAMVPVSNVPMSNAPGAASPMIGLNTPCPMPQPAGNVVCQNGLWMNVGLNTQSPNVTPSCTGAAPGPDYSCVNGIWKPEVAQQAPCPTPSPGANYVCVNGAWVNRN